MPGRHPRYFLGTISGTSIDGLDIALIDAAQEPVSIVAAATVPFPDALSETLRSLASATRVDLDTLGRADAELGTFTGTAARSFLDDAGVAAGDVHAIGSHGQTIHHSPGASPSFTLQIGDPNRIAEASGLDCVADFRRRDMAAGGEGAPLVPPFHAALFAAPDVDRIALNIGGIANITVLPRGRGPVSGFDTGPGNALLDAWVRRHRGAAYDRDGVWAAEGQVDTELLAALAADPYLARPPPKSTGKEYYNLGYVERMVDGRALEPCDVQATLAEFTASSIACAVATWGSEAGEVVVCGGGRLNGDLMTRLARQLSAHRVLPSEALGVDGDAIEAALFAWLAQRFIDGLAGNAPAVTGSSGDRVLGVLAKA